MVSECFRICHVDVENVLVVSATHRFIGNVLETLEYKDMTIWLSDKIFNVSGDLGVIAIQFSKVELAEINRQARNAGIVIVLLGMTVTAAVGLLIGFLLTRRLNMLVKITERFASGEIAVRANLSGGDEIALLGKAFDKTNKKIELNIISIKEGDQRVHAILENAVDAIITISEMGTIEYMNPAAENIFGYKFEEVKGKNINLLMPNPDKDKHDSYHENYLRTGIGKMIGVGSREV